MGQTTGIAWTAHSWNPWIGCTEVSPGCDACYARALDNRHKYGGATHWGAGVPRYRTKSWDQPLRWNKAAAKTGARATVFPSMCDPFDNEVPQEWRIDLFRLIAETPALTWLLLTKRIGNVAKMLPSDFVLAGQPARNVWIGASVVNQEEADRDIPKLLATPAAKRFVSYEPALGPIDFSPEFGNCDAHDYLRGQLQYGEAGDADGVGGGVVTEQGNGIDWVIVGGESSQGGAIARPFDLAWARSTVVQCKAVGVPVFVKQLGSNPTNPSGAVGEREYATDDRAGADMAEWPDDLRVQEFPRELQVREYPAT